MFCLNHQLIICLYLQAEKRHTVGLLAYTVCYGAVSMVLKVIHFVILLSGFCIVEHSIIIIPLNRISTMIQNHLVIVKRRLKTDDAHGSL